MQIFCLEFPSPVGYLPVTKKSPERPTPEQLLAQVELEERHKGRGRLKVFLGYSGGVGKSFRMLDEGRRRRERGEDVVVCALQPRYPSEVLEVLKKLEVIPVRRVDGAEAVDVPAVIHRHPQVALIDGLAYDNPPDSPNAHRWQDVEQLLDAGISVITTVNVQYLEKHQDEVERITGKRASCTIPRGFLDRSADEIVLVDAPATESLERESAPVRGAGLLAQKHKLSRLRELALLVAASVVDRQLETYLRLHGIDQHSGVQERIVVCVSPHLSALRMLESGSRNADRFQGEFHVVYVQERSLSQEDCLTLEQNLDYARELGARVEILTGFDTADAILKFARQKGITQIFVGHSTRHGIHRRIWGSLVDRLIRSAEGMDVVVYPQ
jgi:two-component system, OmpR family, sensor histidine kinase KdpD